MWDRNRRRDEAGAAVRANAYQAVLNSSQRLAYLVGTLGAAIRFRSGLAVDVGVVLRSRRPVEPFALHDWMMSTLGPLLDAWSEVWIVGSQEAVDAADAVVAASGDLVNSAIAVDERPGWPGRLVKVVQGSGPTPKQQQKFQDDLKRLHAARATFVHVVRAELGHVPVTLAIDRAANPT